MLTEAENYLRKFMRKMKDFKEKGIMPSKPTPANKRGSAGALASQQKRSLSKKQPSKETNVKKKSISHLSSTEHSPVKD